MSTVLLKKHRKFNAVHLCRCFTGTSNLLPRLLPGMAPGPILGKPSGRLPMLRIVKELPWISRHPKQPLCNHRRPACQKPHIQCVYQAARPKPLGETSPIVKVRKPKFSFSPRLLVLLTDKLNQASATPSSLWCCTWSVARCTVGQFPVNPGVTRGALSVSNKMVQNTAHQPRNCISQIFSQDQCQVRGCLDYLAIVCIRVAVVSQDLKALALKETFNLLAKPHQVGSLVAPMANCEASEPIRVTSPRHHSTWRPVHRH